MTDDLKADILAVLESSRLPLTMEDIVQDVAVMPVARNEPMRKVNQKEVASEIERLLAKRVIESGVNDGGSELVYRIRIEKRLTQKSLL